MKQEGDWTYRAYRNPNNSRVYIAEVQETRGSNGQKTVIEAKWKGTESNGDDYEDKNTFTVVGC